MTGAAQVQPLLWAVQRERMLAREGEVGPSIARTLVVFGIFCVIAGCVAAFLPVQHASWLRLRPLGVAPEGGLAIGLLLFLAASLVRGRIRWTELPWFLVAAWSAWTIYFWRIDGINELVPYEIRGRWFDALWFAVAVFGPLMLVLGARFRFATAGPVSVAVIALAAAALAVFANPQDFLRLSTDTLLIVSSAPDGKELGMDIRSLHSSWSIVLTAGWLCAIVFAVIAVAFGTGLRGHASAEHAGT